MCLCYSGYANLCRCHKFQDIDFNVTSTRGLLQLCARKSVYYPFAPGVWIQRLVGRTTTSATVLLSLSRRASRSRAGVFAPSHLGLSVALTLVTQVRDVYGSKVFGSFMSCVSAAILEDELGAHNDHIAVVPIYKPMLLRGFEDVRFLNQGYCGRQPRMLTSPVGRSKACSVWA